MAATASRNPSSANFWNSFPVNIPIFANQEDSLLWEDSNEQLSVRRIWETIKTSQPKWNGQRKSCYSRRVLLYIASVVKEKLDKVDRQRNLGLIFPNAWFLCGSGQESIMSLYDSTCHRDFQMGLSGELY